MKSLIRLVVVVLVIAVIYFATIGRDHFYDVLDVLYDFVQAIGSGYMKK
jgi:hypothetical protein